MRKNNKIDIFINKNKELLNQKNKFIIKIDKKDQLEYIKHIICIENYENK